MKLLVSTIKTKCPTTELSLRTVYSVVADAPLESNLKMFDTMDLDSDIYEYILRGQYNMIYFQVDEFNEHRVNRISEMVKKAMPTSVIIVGGMQVSFDTSRYMTNNPCIDYVVRGEGETVFFNFIKSMVTYAFDFDEIAGLGYRLNDIIYVNPYDALVELNELPFPYEKTELPSSDTVYYETIRGTSDRTIYNQYLPDARVRSLPLSRVCTELRYFFVRGVSKVVFTDRMFNYNSQRAYRIIEYIINNDNGNTSFEMTIDGDLLDEETIRLLSEARPGLFTFNIDIASTNAETLAAIGRKENVYQLMYNVTKLQQARNIKMNISIVSGLPFETEQLFARSFNKAYGLGEGTSLTVQPVSVPKGCLLREEADKYGYLYTTYSPYEVISNSFMPASDLIKINTMAKVSAKFINEGFRISIPHILNDTGLKPYEFFIRLTDFIHNEGLSKKMTKKENLYRIVYKFAAELYGATGDTLKLQILADKLHEDMENVLSVDSVKKFERKGWEIEA